VNARLERYISAGLRARTVRESFRFAARELWGGQRLASYRVRENGLRIFIRHRTPDVFALDQAFYQRHFDPPAEVAEILARRAPLKILDLGANIGLFAVAMLGRYPGSTVTAFEPDTANAAVLERVVEANDSPRWTLVRACAAARDGTVAFASGEFGISHVALEGEQVRAVDVFPHLATADLAKIDIEASEWELLSDERFATLQTPVLHLEYHAQNAPGAEPEAAAVEALERAGYAHAPALRTVERAGMLWAWRPEARGGE
jgi:FkbM family methyltransferase